MSAPAKRKNMATTADGAQYNKRQRPDNYAAMLTMPPPPRPASSSASPPAAMTTMANATARTRSNKVIPPPRRSGKWSNWAQKSTTIKDECADDKNIKPDEAAAVQDTATAPKFTSVPGEPSEDAQDTRSVVTVGGAAAVTKSEACASDPTAGATLRRSEVKAEDASDAGNATKKDDETSSDARFSKDHKNEVQEEGDKNDRETDNSEPGSPIDEPGTHFGNFTPMGQRKTIWQKEKDDHDGKQSKKKKNKANEPRRNPVYGQTSAFPMLDEENNNNSGNEDDLEALRYLKQVMTEANGLPITFSGTTYDERGPYDTGDFRGYYEDGAYVACPAPIIGPVIPPGYKNAEASNTDDSGSLEDEYLEEELGDGDNFDVQMVDAQEEYHNRLLLRFEGFRKLLAQTPPENSKASLDHSQWFEFPTTPKAMRLAVRHWLKAFAEKPPHPAQIAQMDSYCVLQLLDILKRKLECFKDINENVSVWIYALLARLTEVLPIYCDEASVVRELALRALMVRVTFTGEHVPELENKVPDYYAEDKDFFEHVEADPRQNKKKQQQQQQENEKPVKTREVPDEDELMRALREKKELIARKEALQKRVDEMPAWEIKREVFGLEPRSASDNEDEEEEKAESEQEGKTPNPNANTRTTLDMILAVACDVWGQKDLSKYREIWGEKDYSRPSVEEEEVLIDMEMGEEGDHGEASVME
ncbi:hypothetical protein B0J12DRAFT_653600 [Macrophomina phaseolina]|uniref:Uncharacterized protein n=1 Tax=Macrophomina phaseolina TaxID=35725 RepID=A0ABQ8GLS7_9PEZI|nr:hypothetical protein B0J12DRAFT_653600 [Macrophomina phaseolina]